MHSIHAEVYARKRLLGPKTWDWRIVASNNEIIATSGGQGFTERNDAKEAVVDLCRWMASTVGNFSVEYVDD